VGLAAGGSCRDRAGTGVAHWGGGALGGLGGGVRVGVEGAHLSLTMCCLALCSCCL
jgi:hypothetical protein